MRQLLGKSSKPRSPLTATRALPAPSSPLPFPRSPWPFPEAVAAAKPKQHLPPHQTSPAWASHTLEWSGLAPEQLAGSPGAWPGTGLTW